MHHLIVSGKRRLKEAIFSHRNKLRGTSFLAICLSTIAIFMACFIVTRGRKNPRLNPNKIAEINPRTQAQAPPPRSGVAFSQESLPLGLSTFLTCNVLED